jgi:hypothetical protein
VAIPAGLRASSDDDGAFPPRCGVAVGRAARWLAQRLALEFG